MYRVVLRVVGVAENHLLQTVVRFGSDWGENRTLGVLEKDAVGLERREDTSTVITVQLLGELLRVTLRLTNGMRIVRDTPPDSSLWNNDHRRDE